MDVRKTAVTLTFALMFMCRAAYSAPVDGWAVYANSMGSSSDGNVYLCKAGDDPFAIVNDGDAVHARFSADGSHIFYLTNNDKLKVVDNKGNNKNELATVNTSGTKGRSPIFAYRPDPNYILLVENDDFYKVGIDGSKTLVHEGTTGINSEIAISSDGKKICGRGNNLYAVTVGGSTQSYNGGDCSSSLSPDGKWLIHNKEGHVQMMVLPWPGTNGSEKTVNISTKRWDNQAFAVNSNDHVVFSWQVRGNGVGVIDVRDETCTEVVVSDINGRANAEYPDFFVGNLPGYGSTISHSSISLENRQPGTLNANTSFSQAHFTVDGRRIGPSEGFTTNSVSFRSIVVDGFRMRTVIK